MIKVNWQLLIVFLLVVILACQPSNPYLEMETRELAKSERYDSLFFGLYLGMPAINFYSRCWKLNEKGVIRQGATNTSVYYEIKDFREPAGMDFYPRFHEEKIVEMPVTFSYHAWAPWNKHLFSDSLKLEVLNLMESWYGDGFIEIPSPSDLQGGNAFVKIDGNRRISIYNKDDRVVNVDIVDLRKMKELQAQLDNGKK